MNNITYAVSVDVNNPIIPYNVYVANVLDSNVRYLEITLYQNGNVIALSNEATATASLVTDDVLIDDSVECTISNNIITVPLEDLQRHGNLGVQVTVTEDTKVLAIPFPIQVRVTPNIAEEAQIDDDSLGSYAEVVREIAAARGDYPDLKGRLDGEFDRIDDGIAAKMNKLGEGSAGMIILSDGSNGVDRSIYSIATSAANGSFNAGVTNKVPTVSAVEQRINGKGFLTAHQDISGKEDKSNKVTSLSESATDAQYPSAKAVYDALEGKANTNHTHSQYLTSHQSLAGLIGTDKVYEILDSALSGDPSNIPALLVDNTVDQTHNPDGHYILYYIDSDEVRHNIFDISDGITSTTTGTSVIGFSPTATVTQTQSGATVSITDKNGTTTANISNGADGQDYVLTSQDKTDIANIVLGELPTTQGVLYGNTSN